MLMRAFGSPELRMCQQQPTFYLREFDTVSHNCCIWKCAGGGLGQGQERGGRRCSYQRRWHFACGTGTLSKQEWRRLFLLAQHRCWSHQDDAGVCLCGVKMHEDHMVFKIFYGLTALRACLVQVCIDGCVYYFTHAPYKPLYNSCIFNMIQRIFYMYTFMCPCMLLLLCWIDARGRSAVWNRHRNLHSFITIIVPMR